MTRPPRTRDVLAKLLELEFQIPVLERKCRGPGKPLHLRQLQSLHDRRRGYAAFIAIRNREARKRVVDFAEYRNAGGLINLFAAEIVADFVGSAA